MRSVRLLALLCSAGVAASCHGTPAVSDTGGRLCPLRLEQPTGNLRPAVRDQFRAIRGAAIECLRTARMKGAALRDLVQPRHRAADLRQGDQREATHFDALRAPARPDERLADGPVDRVVPGTTDTAKGKDGTLLHGAMDRRVRAICRDIRSGRCCEAGAEESVASGVAPR